MRYFSCWLDAFHGVFYLVTKTLQLFNSSYANDCISLIKANCGLQAMLRVSEAMAGDQNAK